MCSQLGRGKICEMPPPLPFQAVSETQLPLESTLRLVPPTATKWELLAGADTPRLPHWNAPSSPLEAAKVIPLEAPCSAMLSHAISVDGSANSHPPKLEFATPAM